MKIALLKGTKKRPAITAFLVRGILELTLCQCVHKGRVWILGFLKEAVRVHSGLRRRELADFAAHENRAGGFVVLVL